MTESTKLFQNEQIYLYQAGRSFIKTLPTSDPGISLYVLVIVFLARGQLFGGAATLLSILIFPIKSMGDVTKP